MPFQPPPFMNSLICGRNYKINHDVTLRSRLIFSFYKDFYSRGLSGRPGPPLRRSQDKDTAERLVQAFALVEVVKK
jgi:hypothetical protein